MRFSGFMFKVNREMRFKFRDQHRISTDEFFLLERKLGPFFQIGRRKKREREDAA